MKNTRELIVIRKTVVTPNMLRVTLGGPDIESLPADQESAYVKLIFMVDGGRLMRTYTIRHQREHEIDIDFMLHDAAGPASSWAQKVEVNDTILVGGPGPKKRINTNGEHYLLVGDMTALPAISVNLATLPANATGCAIIEVVSKQDIQTLFHPEGIELKWVVNSHPGQNENTLLDQVNQLSWLSETTSVWAACEFSSIKRLRKYFKEKGISKENLYISSYWKLGSNEDQHKLIKQKDNA